LFRFGLLIAVTLYFSVVASVSIASLNLSLLLNTVGFYQVSFHSAGVERSFQPEK
jgi:hypothetical protein